MPEPNRIVIDKVDWKSVLPVLRLVSAFRHALQPGKLLVALVAVLAIHLSGTVLDLVWGEPTSEYYSEPSGQFVERSAGVYETFVDNQSYALEAFLWSTIHLQPWQEHGEDGMFEALRMFVVGHPVEYAYEYPWFMLLFGIDVLFVLAMTSGILSRMSASQVCQDKSTSPGEAVCFVSKRWVWYLLTPLMPVMLIAVVGVVLALVGLVLFNIPGADLLGSIGYGIFLLLGFVIAIGSLLLLFALFLIPPALSVEGSDGFDAIARSFNYILFRPWQFAGYLFASAIYLAVVYVLIGTVASLTIDATYTCIDLGVIVDAEKPHPVVEFDADQGSIPGVDTVFDEIVRGNPGEVGGTIAASAWLVSRWFELVTAIVIAILLSTFCCLQTQAYVLMRRSADGTPMDQYDGEAPGDLWPDAATPPVEQETPSETEG